MFQFAKKPKKFQNFYGPKILRSTIFTITVNSETTFFAISETFLSLFDQKIRPNQHEVWPVVDLLDPPGRGFFFAIFRVKEQYRDIPKACKTPYHQ